MRSPSAWRVLSVSLLVATSVNAQGAPLTRQEAVEAALARGPRAALATADTLAGAARTDWARQWPNPSLSLSYSKSTPQYHYSLELPLDLPYVRSPRVASAEASQRAARLMFVQERAAIRMEAETTYTRAVAARQLADLSMRNAADADSIRLLAIRRHEAGDVSDLDVALAALSAGQAANDAAADSLTASSALLDLQVVIGWTSEARLVVTDSLGAPPSQPRWIDTATPLVVRAAGEQVTAAGLAETVERRSWFGQPSLVAGWEHGDPTGAEPGRLPTLGLAFPVPLLNRNRAGIAAAQAELLRARAQAMAIAQSARTERERLIREYTSARARYERDDRLATEALRVASMTLTAYREGAVPLANVLEARRAARDVLARRIRDAADAWVAVAELELLTLTAESHAP